MMSLCDYSKKRLHQELFIFFVLFVIKTGDLQTHAAQMPAPTVTITGENSLEVNFTAVTGAEQYSVTASPRYGTTKSIILSSNTPVTISNLTGSTLYDVSVKPGTIEKIVWDEGFSTAAQTHPAPPTIRTNTSPLPSLALLFFDTPNKARVSEWSVEYREFGTSVIKTAKTRSGKYYSLTLTGLDANTVYQIRGRASKLNKTTNLTESESNFSEWKTLTTDSLEVFCRVDLAEVAFTPNHLSTSSSEFTSALHNITNAYLSISTNGIRIIEITNQTGVPRVYYGIKVKDKNLSSIANFTLTGLNFTNFYFNGNPGDPESGPFFEPFLNTTFLIKHEAFDSDSYVDLSMDITLEDDTTFKFKIPQNDNKEGDSSDETIFSSETILLDGRQITSTSHDSTTSKNITVMANKVLGFTPEFYVRDVFPGTDQLIYNVFRKIPNGKFDAEEKITVFFFTSGLDASILDVNKISYSSSSNGEVTISVPAVDKATKYEVLNGSNAIKTIEESDIDGSDFIKMVVTDLVVGVTYNFNINVETRKQNGELQAFKDISVNITPTSATTTSVPTTAESPTLITATTDPSTTTSQPNTTSADPTTSELITITTESPTTSLEPTTTATIFQSTTVTFDPTEGTAESTSPEPVTFATEPPTTSLEPSTTSAIVESTTNTSEPTELTAESTSPEPVTITTEPATTSLESITIAAIVESTTITSEPTEGTSESTSPEPVTITRESPTTSLEPTTTAARVDSNTTTSEPPEGTVESTSPEPITITTGPPTTSIEPITTLARDDSTTTTSEPIEGTAESTSPESVTITTKPATTSLEPITTAAIVESTTITSEPTEGTAESASPEPVTITTEPATTSLELTITAAIVESTTTTYEPPAGTVESTSPEPITITTGPSTTSIDPITTAAIVESTTTTSEPTEGTAESTSPEPVTITTEPATTSGEPIIATATATFEPITTTAKPISMAIESTTTIAETTTSTECFFESSEDNDFTPTFSEVTTFSLQADWIDVPNINSYTVSLQCTDCENKAIITKSSAESEISFISLQAGNKYEVCVTADLCFAGDRIPTSNCSSTPSLPAAVTDVIKTVQLTSVVLMWEEVPGAESYIITIVLVSRRKRSIRRKKSLIRATDRAAKPPYKITGLAKNSRYIFSVTASNTAGQSDPFNGDLTTENIDPTYPPEPTPTKQPTTLGSTQTNSIQSSTSSVEPTVKTPHASSGTETSSAATTSIGSSTMIVSESSTTGSPTNTITETATTQSYGTTNITNPTVETTVQSTTQTEQSSNNPTPDTSHETRNPTKLPSSDTELSKSSTTQSPPGPPGVSWWLIPIIVSIIVSACVVIGIIIYKYRSKAERIDLIN